MKSTALAALPAAAMLRPHPGAPSATPARYVISPSPADSPNRVLIDRWLRWTVVAGLAVAALLYGIRSVHWPLMLDSPVMHYVIFLMHHGFKPYSQISDNNMPGAYLTEAWAMQAFGPSDLGWRIYEFVLLGLLTGAAILITLPSDWLAGVYAAGLFITFHASEGPRQAVEREEVIAVLVMIGYTAMFLAVRQRRPWYMGVFGFLGGMASSIKPTFLPLVLALLCLESVALRRRRAPLAPYLGWAAAGLGVAAALNLELLLRYGVVRQFLFVTRMVTPVYRGASSRTLFIASRTIPKYILPLLLLAILCGIGNWSRGGRWNWERVALALGVFFGLFSYFAQGKGLVYHRYVYLVCLMPLIGLEALDATRSHGWVRRAGVLTLAATVLCTVPLYLNVMYHVANNSDFTLALEDDLRHLGGSRSLQGQVQCFDMTDGCLNALYHLRIVENIAFTGDLFFFSKHDSAPTEYYHKVYWEQYRKNPPSVLVISNQFFGEPDGFDKLRYYPSFDDNLHTNFTQVIARNFPMEDETDPRKASKGEDAAAYRVYVRKGSPPYPQETPAASPATDVP